MPKKRRPANDRPPPLQDTTDARSRPYLVFVSYATQDKWIARWICGRIERVGLGLTTFRDDRNIAGGDSIPKTIKHAVRDCREMLVLLTPQSQGREWVISEVAIAAVLEKRIVALYYAIDA